VRNFCVRVGAGCCATSVLLLRCRTKLQMVNRHMPLLSSTYAITTPAGVGSCSRLCTTHPAQTIYHQWAHLFWCSLVFGSLCFCHNSHCTRALVSCGPGWVLRLFWWLEEEKGERDLYSINSHTAHPAKTQPTTTTLHTHPGPHHGHWPPTRRDAHPHTRFAGGGWRGPTLIWS
jgi:hypothetical protein